LYGLLGELPPRDLPISAEMICEEDRGLYVLEKLTLHLNGIEPVPAYFTRPKQADPSTDPKRRLPTILYNHAHGGDYVLGKDELIRGRQALQNPPYAEALADLGCGAFCIDDWNFGERRGRTESELFKEMLWQGRVLWGMMVYDHIRALDYLCGRDDVDPRRIGTLGLSMGSTMSWWLAALDERISFCIDICCLTDFEELIRLRGLDLHGLYYYVPSLLDHFSTAEINALIAPRPHLSLAGDYDPLTPPRGLDRIDAELRAEYAAAGAPEAWRLLRFPCGHLETAAMRREIIEWIRSRI